MGYAWDEFTHMPSRFSAEPIVAAEDSACSMKLRGKAM